MRVSVIIPTLNEQATIGAAIQSALTAGADEVIVADGGSTDRTTTVAEDWAIVVRCETGRAIQQNAGAERSSGDVLVFLHADCRLNPNAIDVLRDKMMSSEQLVAGCFRQQIDHTAAKYRLVEGGNALRVRLLKWAYGDQGIFTRANVFRSLGGFPDVRFLEDLLFMKRVKRAGRIQLLDESIIVSARRWQHRGLVRQTLRNWAIITAAHLGVSVNTLAKFYPNDR